MDCLKEFLGKGIVLKCCVKGEDSKEYEEGQTEGDVCKDLPKQEGAVLIEDSSTKFFSFFPLGALRLFYLFYSYSHAPATTY